MPPACPVEFHVGRLRESRRELEQVLVESMWESLIS